MSTVAESFLDTPLGHFHPTIHRWFTEAFDAPTPAQTAAWPSISEGRSTLLLAPTGSGKTLAAFLAAIDRIMFGPKQDDEADGVRVLYISPLKALGVDVERNLRSPIAGVRAIAERDGLEYHVPAVGVRSGDTPSSERYRLSRKPPDILITTPESLYLILTSRARDILRTTETVIVDEIHSMVGTKRGSHLFLSLERLECLRRADDPERKPMQRIGLSATQRPLEEVARLLGGAEANSDPEQSPRPRPVEIIEAGRTKQLELQVEVPVEDMARMADPELQTGPAAAGPTTPSIWPSIHPWLVQLVRQHRSIQNSSEETEAEVYILAATDPANPYGAALRWPQSDEISSRPQRVAGARVLIRQPRPLVFRVWEVDSTPSAVHG